MGLSFIGVGSGLELGKVLEQLEAGERMRLTPMTLRKKTLDAKISAFGQLKSVLAKFGDATEKLKSVEGFQSRSVTGGDGFFKATATGDVPLGNYTINITQLAQSHSLASAPINDTKSALGNGDNSRTIVIEQADGRQLEVELGQDQTSLESIAQAINNATIEDEDGKAQPSSVNASVVRSSDGGYQLVITAKESGEAHAITAIRSTDEQLNDVLGFDVQDQAGSAMKSVVEAKDAQFNFNGIDMTSSSNTINDIIPGLNIKLTGVTGSAKTLAVGADNEKTKETIKAWVDAFNELQATVAALTKFNKADSADGVEAQKGTEAANGPLLGDSTVRNIDRTLRSILSQEQPGTFNVLSQIGISMGDDGRLKIDDQQLDKAISEHGGDVAALFTGKDDQTGLANQLQSAVKGYVGSDGLLDNSTNSLKESAKSLQKSYDRMEDSIEQTLARYRSQFANLDQLVSSLNNTSSYLANQFAAMSK